MTVLRSRFEVVGAVHLIRPLGRVATDLHSLRLGIAEVEPASLFYHAVQPPLRAPASADLPPDDFSAWVGGVLQDYEAAERLSFAVQRSGPGPEALRTALASALDRSSGGREVPLEAAFAFLAGDTVPVPILECDDLETLMDTLARADSSAWFYHLIEQPWYAAGGEIPLTRAVRASGAPRFADRIEQLTSAGLPLETLRRDVMRSWRRSQLGGRVARAAGASDADRADDAHDAVARLARRIVRGSEAS